MVGRIRCLAVLAAATAAVATGCGGAHGHRPAPTATAGRAPAHRQLDAPLTSRLQRALDEARHDAGIPGASAAVLIRGGALWSGTSGVADARTHAPVTPDTLFEAGSVTKTLVAALVLKLSDRGVLGLDDHLARWVPRFPEADRITIRQLLDHTAGTKDFLGIAAFARAQERAGQDAVWDPRRTLRYVREPLGPPGAQWAYSNTDYILLGLVVERATHSTVARQLHRRLLPRRRF